MAWAPTLVRGSHGEPYSMAWATIPKTALGNSVFGGECIIAFKKVVASNRIQPMRRLQWRFLLKGWIQDP